MPSEGLNGEKEAVVGTVGSSASEDDDGFFTSAVSVQHKVSEPDFRDMVPDGPFGLHQS